VLHSGLCGIYGSFGLIGQSAIHENRFCFWQHRRRHEENAAPAYSRYLDGLQDYQILFTKIKHILTG
jgi:hypothetical protein